jgi:hypothetical protein
MEFEEVAQAIDRLHGAIADLAMRGLRSAGPRDLAVLRGAREEFEQVGADHLAARVAEILRTAEAGDRSAARALLQAQASLRVFERVLTLEVAARALQGAAAGGQGGEAP